MLFTAKDEVTRYSPPPIYKILIPGGLFLLSLAAGDFLFSDRSAYKLRADLLLFLFGLACIAGRFHFRVDLNLEKAGLRITHRGLLKTKTTYIAYREIEDVEVSILGDVFLSLVDGRRRKINGTMWRVGGPSSVPPSEARMESKENSLVKGPYLFQAELRDRIQRDQGKGHQNTSIP